MTDDSWLESADYKVWKRKPLSIGDGTPQSFQASEIDRDSLVIERQKSLSPQSEDDSPSMDSGVPVCEGFYTALPTPARKRLPSRSSQTRSPEGRLYIARGESPWNPNVFYFEFHAALKGRPSSGGCQS